MDRPLQWRNPPPSKRSRYNDDCEMEPPSLVSNILMQAMAENDGNDNDDQQIEADANALTEAGLLPKDKNTPKYPRLINALRFITDREKVLSPIEHAQSNIQNLIKHVKKNIETKSRKYRPHMSIEQLEFVLKCWDEIGRQVDDPTSDDAVTKYIVDLALELDEGVSHYKLVRFLQGDSEKKLSEGQIQNVRRKLETWQRNQD